MQKLPYTLYCAYYSLIYCAYYAQISSTLDNYSILDPPSEVTAQPTSSKSIKVSWILPQNISKCGAIQGYELSYSASKSSTSVLNVGVTTFAEITGLKPYTTYNISVRTKAYSEYSSPCTATTKEDGRL